MLKLCLLLLAFCRLGLQQQPPPQEFYLVHLRQPPKDWKLPPIAQLIKEQTSCEEIEDDFHFQKSYSYLCPINEVEFWLQSSPFGLPYRPSWDIHGHVANLTQLVESVIDLQGNKIYPQSISISRNVELGEDEIIFQKYLSNSTNFYLEYTKIVNNFD